MADVIEKLKELVAEGDLLANQVPLDPDHPFDREYTRWAVSCKQVLEHAELADYAANVEKARKLHDISRIVGYLKSACDMMEGSFTTKVKFHIHAELFDSLVDQADHLLKIGHRIAAAVYGRIVIENWLRDEGQKANIPGHDIDTAAVVNDKLKKARVFSKPKWRQVQACLDVGNKAAHGETSEFDDAEVKRMLEFARANCL